MLETGLIEAQNQRFTFRINHQNVEFADTIKNAGFTPHESVNVHPKLGYRISEQTTFTHTDGTLFQFTAHGFTTQQGIQAFEDWDITKDGAPIASGEVLGQESLNWLETALRILCNQ